MGANRHDVRNTSGRFAPGVGATLDDVARRFWPRVEKTETCWLWRGSTHGIGYGEISVNGRLLPVHRLSWMLEHGDPGSAWVLHHCDTPACVRPSHLFLGDNDANMKDASKKGRLNRRVCKNGHDKDVVGVVTYPSGGGRKCLVCAKAKWTRNNHRQRHAALAAAGEEKPHADR